jgi:hypothetical protein
VEDEVLCWGLKMKVVVLSCGGEGDRSLKMVVWEI